MESPRRPPSKIWRFKFIGAPLSEGRMREINHTHFAHIPRIISSVRRRRQLCSPTQNPQLPALSEQTGKIVLTTLDLFLRNLQNRSGARLLQPRTALYSLVQPCSALFCAVVELLHGAVSDLLPRGNSCVAPYCLVLPLLRSWGLYQNRVIDSDHVAKSAGDWVDCEQDPLFWLLPKTLLDATLPGPCT